MINDDVQKQEGGDSSTNLQGKTITINQGINYTDAKAIALDVYKANFLQLSQDAAQLARDRAEEITDNFLSKLNERNSNAVESISTPGMQAALYEAQKQYAKTGDKNLEGLLVDILVERAGATERNIQQIVLDESLEVASKLTTEQMDALTINFLLTKTKNNSLINLQILSKYIDTDLLPFLSELTDSSSCYEHLEYVGCGSPIHLSRLNSIEQIYRKAYAGLFSKGFDQVEFEKSVGSISVFSQFLMPCLHFPNLLQFKASDIEILEKFMEEGKVEQEIRVKITSLFNSSTMSAEEIKAYLLSAKPGLKKLFELWTNCSISRFSLTTVGIAIAHANYRRRTGVKLKLSEWIT